MTLPFWIRKSSRLPVRMGKLFTRRPFLAVTLGPVIFFPGRGIDLRVLRHEMRHVHQFYVFWALGLLAWLVIRPAWWWLCLTPLTFTGCYVMAGIIGLFFDRDFYRDNPFEKDARRHAGEPV